MTTASDHVEARLKQPQPTTGASHRLTLALAAILLLGLDFASCGGDPKPNSARANVAQAVPVSVSPAQLRDMPYYLTGLGAVSAYYTDSIKTRVDGELVQVNFKEGQFV